MNGGVPDDVELCNFFFVDNGAMSTEEMTDVALVETIKNSLEGEGSSEPDTFCAVPTSRELMDVVDILCSFVNLQDDKAALDALVSLEHRVVASIRQKQQAKITQLFSIK